MSTLFDIVDTLFQNSSNDSSTKNEGRVEESKILDENGQLPTLFILDETLRNIHETRSYSKNTMSKKLSPLRHEKTKKNTSPVKKITTKLKETSPVKQALYSYPNHIKVKDKMPPMKRINQPSPPPLENQEDKNSSASFKNTQKYPSPPPLENQEIKNSPTSLIDTRSYLSTTSVEDQEKKYAFKNSKRVSSKFVNDLRLDIQEAHTQQSPIINRNTPDVMFPLPDKKDELKKAPPNAGKKKDPDVAARDCLRTVNEEIKRWQNEPNSKQIAHEFGAYLTEQYFTNILLKLPSTRFVEHAQQRVAARIEEIVKSQDLHNLPLKTSLNSEAIEETLGKIGISTRTELPSNTEEIKKNKQRQEILEKLLQLPEDKLKKLPKAQQDLVSHTKRYRQMLQLSPAELDSLPADQKQMFKYIHSQIGIS